jgi:hypothetical protein
VRDQPDLARRRGAVGAQRVDRQHRADREGAGGRGVEAGPGRLTESADPSEAATFSAAERDRLGLILLSTSARADVISVA